MERYVPVFANLETSAFLNLSDDELTRMVGSSSALHLLKNEQNIPEEARRKILTKLKTLKENPKLNLEELEWEISWEGSLSWSFHF